MIGQTLSHYRVLSRLGGGGMGVVYEAENLSLRRHVALKLLPADSVGSREALERLKREARAASSLNHPGICVIHEIGEDKGDLFIVMELMEGKTLKHRIGASPMDVEQVLDVGVQIADALDAAHAKGIVHRDVKPSVSGALEIELLRPGARSRAAEGRSSAAYSLYLQGRYYSERRSPRDLEKAVSYYEQALRLDPADARAWAGLSIVHYLQAGYSYVPLHDSYRAAREEAEKALQLDPNLAEAHAALGRVRKSYDWDREGAEAAFKRALELEPGNPRVVLLAADSAMTLGRAQEALELGRRAVELDPLSVSAHSELGFDCWYADRLEEAEAAFRRALELSPGYPAAHKGLGLVQLSRSDPAAALHEVEQETGPFWRRYGMALAYHALGRRVEADASLAELLDTDTEGGAFQIAEVYAFRGEPNRAFDWLDRAYAQHDGGLNGIKGDPLLRRLETDPRYPALLVKLRLPP